MKKENIILIIAVLLVGILIAVTFISKNNANTNIKDITIEEATKMIEEKDTFFLYVARTGCSACENFEPVLKKALNSNDTSVYKIDMANETTEATTAFYNKYSITGTPTVLSINEGNEGLLYNRLNGAGYTQDEIIEFINKNSN